MSNENQLANELFHQASIIAFVEAARAQGGWPCPDQVRRKAYAIYEQELANSERNRGPILVDCGQELGLPCLEGKEVP